LIRENLIRRCGAENQVVVESIVGHNGSGKTTLVNLLTGALAPDAGSVRLGANLAMAIDAFRRGHFGMLFGPLDEAIRNIGGKSNSLGQLREEFLQLSRLAQDGNGHDWRCFFLPLLNDGQLQQINLFYRRSKREQSGDDEKGEDATRFIVEVTFSRLGPCQLDGLVGKGRFDLMVRSHRDLPERIRREINGLFAQARDLGRYAGEVAFQTTPRFPISPIGDVAKAPPDIIA
jgi:energy-coupling factor transporter ATP-binding protein EcfA2